MNGFRTHLAPSLSTIFCAIFLFFIHLNLANTVSASFCFTDCYSKKGCFFKPYGCVPYVNCTYGFSYQSDGEWAYLELLGQGNSERNAFVAAAFSRDQQMGDDSVVECSSFNNGPLLGRASYNQGKTNIRLNLEENRSNSFIRTLAIDFYNGMIYCQIARKIQVPNGVDPSRVFPLNNQYYILMAASTTTLNSNGIGVLQVHNLNTAAPNYPLVSAATVSVNQYQVPANSVMPSTGAAPQFDASGRNGATNMRPVGYPNNQNPGQMGPNPSNQSPNFGYINGQTNGGNVPANNNAMYEQNPSNQPVYPPQNFNSQQGNPQQQYFSPGGNQQQGFPQQNQPGSNQNQPNQPVYSPQNINNQQNLPGNQNSPNQQNFAPSGTNQQQQPGFQPQNQGSQQPGYQPQNTPGSQSFGQNPSNQQGYPPQGFNNQQPQNGQNQGPNSSGFAGQPSNPNQNQGFNGPTSYNGQPETIYGPGNPPQNQATPPESGQGQTYPVYSGNQPNQEYPGNSGQNNPPMQNEGETVQYPNNQGNTQGGQTGPGIIPVPIPLSQTQQTTQSPNFQQQNGQNYQSTPNPNTFPQSSPASANQGQGFTQSPGFGNNQQNSGQPTTPFNQNQGFQPGNQQNQGFTNNPQQNQGTTMLPQQFAPNNQNPNQQSGPNNQNPNQQSGPNSQNQGQQPGVNNQNQQGLNGPNGNQQSGPASQSPNQQSGPNSFNEQPQGNPSYNGQGTVNGGPLRDTFSSQGIVPGSDNPIEPQLLKVHAILMTLAWMIFVSTALLFARFYRGLWPNTTLCGLFLWFHFHRTLNLIGIGAMIAGFVCIFVARDWHWQGPKANNTSAQNRAWPSIHSILGLLACLVAWAQPLNAVFRCHPKATFRPIYNIVHPFFGYGAYVMGAAALMIACTHFDFMFTNRDAAFGLCIAFLCTTGAVFIFLEVMSVFHWFRNRQSTGDIEVIQPDGTTQVTLSEQTRKMNVCRLLVFVFYIIVAIGCAVAISCLIGIQSNEFIRQNEAFFLARPPRQT